MINEDRFDLVIQINGKTRAVITVKKDIDKKEAKRLAMDNQVIARWLISKEVKKIIFVPNRLINFIL